MSKEPGQMLWEVWGELMRLPGSWEGAPVWSKEKYASVESTIRADERAKVIEECAEVAASRYRGHTKIFGTSRAANYEHAGNAIVTALRSKIGESNG